MPKRAVLPGGDATFTIEVTNTGDVALNTITVTDALCYSTTDLFAAGFMDHAIGPVLGVDDNTGAGGANVFSHADIIRFFPTNGQRVALSSAAEWRQYAGGDSSHAARE